MFTWSRFLKKILPNFFWLKSINIKHIGNYISEVNNLGTTIQKLAHRPIFYFESGKQFLISHAFSQ